MYWNVHLDGLERTHDLIVEREGVFKECILAIKMAKMLGYQVATNTTIYKETDMEEIEQMFDFLSDLGVDGHTISPGYEYDAAKKDMIKRLNLQPENFFLTRQMTIEKFKKIEQWMKDYTLFGTPIYFEFLAGKRDLTCSAWAIPTRNIRGWKGPCYLMTDAHYSSYQELAGESAVGQIRRRKRRGERQPLRELHGPLRLRADRQPRPERAARRHLEDGAVQLRRETKTDRPRQRDRRLQRRDLRQRTSHRQKSRAGRAGFVSRRTWVIPQPTSLRCRGSTKDAPLAWRSNEELAEAIALRAGKSAPPAKARRPLGRRADGR